jgi:Glycosyl hydrolase family 12
VPHLSRRALVRRAVCLPCLAGAMAMAAAMLTGVPARAARAAGPPSKLLCRRYQHATVRTSWGARFVVKDDNFGRQRLCLAVSGGWPNFAVTRSSVHSRTAGPQAYPFILRGCSWGTCSAHSGLPRQVRRLWRPEATWYTSQHARGRWDAAFDVWFGRRPLATGQARGAEIMIWLSARGLGRPARAPVVRLAGARWYFRHWRACHGDCWNYLQFRRVRPTSGVKNLRLMPFIARARARHLIRPGWWMENIEAGFELWRGGRGLATRWFWARP